MVVSSFPSYRRRGFSRALQLFFCFLDRSSGRLQTSASIQRDGLFSILGVQRLLPDRAAFLPSVSRPPRTPTVPLTRIELCCRLGPARCGAVQFLRACGTAQGSQAEAIANPIQACWPAGSNCDGECFSAQWGLAIGSGKLARLQT